MKNISRSIIFCESSPNIGGQELQLLQQMQELKKRGYRVHLLCKPGSRIADFAKRQGIEFTEIAFRNALHLPSILAVRRQLVSLNANAIIVHSGHDSIVGAIAARTMGKRRPAIIRMRTYQWGAPSAFPYQHLFDHSLACSSYLREQILLNPKISPSKVGVLYPGIDFLQLESGADKCNLPFSLKNWLDSHPGPIVLHAAMLRPEKGHLTILRALPAILETHPDLRYVIAGEGHLRSEIQALIEDNGLEENVYLAGLVNPIAPLLGCASLAILPSLVEPLGMFQIEALELGIPVVASRVGGIPETISHEKSGLLVEANNVAEWSKAITWALSHLETMRAWAQCGKNDNRVRFGVQSNTAQLIHQLDHLVVSDR